jgi:ATP-dependent protease ClpP protease subunit
MNDLQKEAVAKKMFELRRVLLSGKIDRTSIDKVIRELVELDFTSNEPILLLIDSRGGDLDEVFHLQDLIGSLKAPVDCLVVREAFSAALTTVQICRFRYALPNARLFAHESKHTFDIPVTTNEFLQEGLEAIGRQLRAQLKRKMELFMSRTSLSEKQCEQLFQVGGGFDVMLGAQRAKDLHLIDSLVLNFKLWEKFSP